MKILNVFFTFVVGLTSLAFSSAAFSFDDDDDRRPSEVEDRDFLESTVMSGSLLI